MENKNLWRSSKFTKAVVALSLLLTASVIISLFGCSAPQEAAKPRARAVVNSGNIVPSTEIRVGEYLQYYEQHFPEPQSTSIGMDLRLGNSMMPVQGGMAWLQVGLQTKSAEIEVVAPLNLCIVIDRSGSMSDADKMPYLKQSLSIFLESLNRTDIVSIVAYDSTAEVILPPQSVGDGRWIQATIDRIQPGGSTNLHAGMILGFQQVDKNFNIQRNNRVILLTDGIANTGETNPDKIAANALVYNQEGITLSTIGLGLDFNDGLLTTLARQGKGGYTFVDSAKEMEKVFSQQVNSLKQWVASDVQVQIVPQNGVKLIGLTGLDGTPPSGGASVTLWSMSLESSLVVMAQLQVNPGAVGPRCLATVALKYFDEMAQRTVTLENSITVEMTNRMTSYDPTWDLEVFRNVTIQETAEGMKEIDRLFQNGQYETAWRLAVKLEKQLLEVARLTNDSQMQEDANLMNKYQQTLADALWQTEHRTPAGSTESTERPYRGSTLPTVEVK